MSSMHPLLQALPLDATGWGQLAGYFLSLSLLSVGGAIATAPDMYRHLVVGQQWMTGEQFSASISIAQAAPGPNILFVALIGWNVGLNAAGPQAGWWGYGVALAVSMVCLWAILLPSSLLVWSSTRWMQHNRQRRSVRAFRWGMTPLVVGMVLATGWILAARASGGSVVWAPWLLSAVCMVLVWKTRLHLLWMLAAGAVLGALGWV